ncbi:uncharacterized protein LOC130380356 isoform X2 [Gadus chalcogrammus]|nr:uncharacterized protein LOC130380356 isoform X2 [Gadus chalcogrammus]XP_056443512.1 uncharacterized protein LOC130380356 isoform X2 [Gadus chalcogrammus]
MTEDTTITLIVTATPNAVTIEHHNPESAGDVSNASLTYLLDLLRLIVPVLVCVGGFAWWKKCKGNPLSNEQRPQSAPQADPVSASEEVAEREIFVPQPPVAEDLEMETMNNTNSNENM